MGGIENRRYRLLKYIFQMSTPFHIELALFHFLCNSFRGFYLVVGCSEVIL